VTGPRPTISPISPGDVAAVVAYDADAVKGRGHTHRAALADRVVAVEDGNEAFGHPVELVESAGQGGVQLVLILLQKRRAERQDALKRREALRVETRCAEQRDDLRRHEHDMGCALALYRGNCFLRIELAM
jgi:hypothetical protein